MRKIARPGLRGGLAGGWRRARGFPAVLGFWGVEVSGLVITLVVAMNTDDAHRAKLKVARVMLPILLAGFVSILVAAFMISVPAGFVVLGFTFFVIVYVVVKVAWEIIHPSDSESKRGRS